jgi:hypothetical protein
MVPLVQDLLVGTIQFCHEQRENSLSRMTNGICSVTHYCTSLVIGAAVVHGDAQKPLPPGMWPACRG